MTPPQHNWHRGEAKSQGRQLPTDIVTVTVFLRASVSHEMKENWLLLPTSEADKSYAALLLFPCLSVLTCPSKISSGRVADIKKS